MSSRGAVQQVLRSPLGLTAVFVASAAVTLAVLPDRLDIRHRPPPVDAVTAMFADHDCVATLERDPDGLRPLVLVTIRGGNPQIIDPGDTTTRAGTDRFAEVHDWLTDEYGVWYGWCR